MTDLTNQQQPHLLNREAHPVTYVNDRYQPIMEFIVQLTKEQIESVFRSAANGNFSIVGDDTSRISVLTNGVQTGWILINHGAWSAYAITRSGEARFCGEHPTPKAATTAITAYYAHATTKETA